MTHPPRNKNKIFMISLYLGLHIYNPQNHPNEFLKRNGLIFVGMLKRSGSILDKIQWH